MEIIEWVVCGAFGVAICIIGILNTLGQINSVHWYHRHKVRPEDVLPFGRMMGAGMLTLGGSMILFAVLMAVHSLLAAAWLAVVATVIMIIGAVVGLTLNLWAMIKYNKGIF